DLADRKHEIYDEDLHALVSETSYEKSEYFKLVSLKAQSETGEVPSAKITLLVDGEEKIAEANGGGTVDATFRAIEEIVTSQSQLQLYSVNNITTGTDAQGEVTVRLQKSGRIVNGHGADTDIILASAKAYLHALNKLEAPETRAHPQHDI
ncbi:MAG: 2-isopropylmalate synthase, partial [Gammaproteobacteria bacterium]|nr:2-isopropylmalate synthase [Gammaproteobacteria bacterium]